MKNLILVSLMPLILSSCATSPPRNNLAAEVQDVPYRARTDSEETLRHRILVLPFLEDAKNQKYAKALEEARRVVVRELGLTRRFVILEPKDFPKDLKSLTTAEGDYDLEEISKIANGMGVSAVMEGKIIEVRARRVGDSMGLIRNIKAEVSSEIRVRLFSARNGKEILNETRAATVETTTRRFMENQLETRLLEEDPSLVRDSIRRAFSGSVDPVIRAIEKLSWEGRIALISGERVFVNAGRLSGLQVGDILKVSEEGEDVYDPETGRFIGKAPGRLKGSIEVISYFGKDGTIAVYHSGSGFKENDKVELY